MTTGTGLYIHIPFCKRTCFYCHFVKTKYDSAMTSRYVDALATEITLKKNSGLLIDSIYFGGGSPSLLSENQLTTIMDAVHRNFKVAEDVETTLEVNPDDVDVSSLRMLKRAGINRLSIGTQSFLAGDLDYLKRTHSAGQSLSAVENALNEGFDNLNIDYIISLPGQTAESLRENFQLLERLPIPHISAYILEGVIEGEEKNERDHELYFFTKQQLNDLGYEHYEVSNYSKPGSRSRHNLKYWTGKSYLAVGLSASGYEGGRDYKNVDDFDIYFQKIAEGSLPLQRMEPPDIDLRRIIMGLRLLEGIPVRYFESFGEPLNFLESNGILIRRKGNIAVEPEKILMLNEILTYF